MTSTSTAYWRIVYECMVQLFQQPDVAARMRIRDLRQRLQRSPEGLRRDMVYHREPYDLAQALSGGDAVAMTPELRMSYDAIVERCTADAAVMGTDEEVLELSAV